MHAKQFTLITIIFFVIAGGVYIMTHTNDPGSDDWQQLWDARLAALERVLGPSDNTVMHSPVPFYLGGAADVLAFRKHNDGIVYVTADLIGDDSPKSNEMGQYELMVCLREEDDWAPQLISNLAIYTIDAVLSPGDTMDIGSGLPQPTNLTAFLYLSYAKITVNDDEAGILLCLGITADELSFVREKGVDELISRLKLAGVYPYTDLVRQSVLLHQ